MARIEGLLQELCPEGVPYRTLGEIGSVVRGKRFTKNDMTGAGVPCIHYGEIYSRYGVSASKSFSFLTEERAAGLRFAQPGDVILASAGETVEDIGKAVAWLGKSPVAIHDACYAFSSGMDAKFVSYFFASRLFRDQIRSQISSSKVSSISTRNVAAAKIPVPPIEVQREIVRVLDELSELQAGLEAGLEAELKARRRQHEHYRSRLLNFSDDVPRRALSEMGTLFGGLTGKSKADFANGNARFATYKNVFANIALDIDAPNFVRVAPGERQRSLAYGDVIFTGSSESFDQVGMSSVVTKTLLQPMYLNSFCIGFRPHDLSLLDPGFAKHLFRSEHLRSQIRKTASGVTRINVSKARLAKVRVPIPAPAEQARIARTLDQFEALISDLSISLPAELAARRKQYEYYRDKLLTFEEAPA